MNVSRVIFQLLFQVVVVLAAGSLATAATIDVGHYTLQPNLSRQEIQLFASGNESVSALEFNIQIGDGGTSLGGDDPGPTITFLDLTHETIFSAGGTNQIDVVQFPLVRQSSVDVSTAVNATGLIATIELDTHGVPPGAYDLRLANVAGDFNTTFFDSLGEPIVTEISDGTITIVPEPSMMIFGTGASLLPAILRRNRRRTRTHLTPESR